MQCSKARTCLRELVLFDNPVGAGEQRGGVLLPERISAFVDQNELLHCFREHQRIRTAVWTGVTRDTMPLAVITCAAYSITSSASRRNGSGIVSPSDFA